MGRNYGSPITVQTTETIKWGSNYEKTTQGDLVRRREREGEREMGRKRKRKKLGTEKNVTNENEERK